jgi:peptidoglycan hydrolase CwlO-like protein
MPWDYEETIRIDADDILDYVKENKDWFLNQLGESKQSFEPEIINLQRQIENIIYKYDCVRKARDEQHENSPATQLYEELIFVKEKVGELLK